MKTEKISVEGMACSHCTASVTSALTALNGVSEVSVSLDSKCAAITYDESVVTHKTITDVICDLGFTVVE